MQTLGNATKVSMFVPLNNLHYNSTQNWACKTRSVITYFIFSTYILMHLALVRYPGNQTHDVASSMLVKYVSGLS